MQPVFSCRHLAFKNIQLLLIKESSINASALIGGAIGIYTDWLQYIQQIRSMLISIQQNQILSGSYYSAYKLVIKRQTAGLHWLADSLFSPAHIIDLLGRLKANYS
jgi:hypothetical protein